MPTVDEFLQVLFNEGEHTNVTPVPWMTAVNPIFALPEYVEKVYVCINPLKPGSTRSDANVAAYRSILVEMDNIPLQDQWKVLEETKLPFSTCVFSGSKSFHVVITLSEDLADRATYDALVRRVYKAIGKDVDVANKNPSRTTRFPGAIRPETKKEQNLVRVNSRISLEQLEAWLIERGVPPEPPRQPTPRLNLPEGVKGHLSGKTQLFLMQGAPEGEWNPSLFAAACDLFRNNYEFDEAVEVLERITGHLDKKDLSTIRSAEKRVNQDQA